MKKPVRNFVDAKKLAIAAFQIWTGVEAVTNNALQMGQSELFSTLIAHVSRSIRDAASQQSAEAELLLCIARLRVADSRLARC